MTQPRQNQMISRRIAFTLIGVQALTFFLVISVMMLVDEIRNPAPFAALEFAKETLLKDRDEIAVTFESIRNRHSETAWLIVDGTPAIQRFGPVPPGIEGYLALQDVNAIGFFTVNNTPAILSSLPTGETFALGGITSNPFDLFPIFLADIGQAALWFLVPIIGITALIVPTITRRLLFSLDQTVRTANEISPDMPETRLPLEPVPYELVPMVEGFNRALDRLEDGQRREARFLADAAHELRTPLTIVQTRLDELPDSPLRTKLQSDIKRLSKMADTLLDIQRVRSSAIVKSNLRLDALVAEIARDIAVKAVEREQDLTFDAPDGPVELVGDEIAIRRAVGNVLDNAILYSGEGADIEITVERPARVRIADTGVGFPELGRDLMTDPFVRGPETTQFTSGAGLGLHLSLTMTQAHGGGLTISDRAGGGAEVILDFSPTE